MSIKALIEAYRDQSANDEVDRDRIAEDALPEIEELVRLNRELFVTGAKPKTRHREREIKDRIREICDE